MTTKHISNNAPETSPVLTEDFGKLFIPVSHCPLSHSEILNCSHYPWQPPIAPFPPRDSWHIRRDIIAYKTLPMSVLWENVYSKKLEKLCSISEHLLFLESSVLLHTSMPLPQTVPSTCNTGHLSRPRSNFSSSPWSSLIQTPFM